MALHSAVNGIALIPMGNGPKLSPLDAGLGAGMRCWVQAWDASLIPSFPK